jgi:ribosomal protein S18 acetylase RimI-like enzyme
MWRPMKDRDLKKVHAISLAQWGTLYYESIDIFKNKLDFYPEGCFVYEKEGLVQGYVISFPWMYDNVPEINKILPIVDLKEFCEKQCYYIHDIVLMPEYRGSLIGAEIIEKLIKVQPLVCLVAPAPTQHYWRKYYGFEKTELKCEEGVHMQLTK